MRIHTGKTDREISADLHEQLQQQIYALRQLAGHASHRYITAMIAQSAQLLEQANTAWKDEEAQAQCPLWR